jgi:hypothetical protein
MKQVNWEGVPDDLIDLLTTTTAKGEYVNLSLIKVLNHSKLSQSDLHALVRESGIYLTLPAIRKYIDEVESARLMSTPPTTGTQAKQYTITQRGEACKEAIKIVLPRSYFSFYVRNYLGIRRIPQFPP